MNRRALSAPILAAMSLGLVLGRPAWAQEAGPVLVVQTAKGSFEIQTYPEDAPKTVEHVLALVERNFYRGLRVHRVVPGFVVQLGDPKTRDMTKRAIWGQPPAGSGNEIGVLETSKRRSHVKGAVAMAHAGDPKEADSQFYIMLTAQPKLDGEYTVWGQVTSGIEVVEQIREADVIRNITVKESGTE